MSSSHRWEDLLTQKARDETSGAFRPVAWLPRRETEPHPLADPFPSPFGDKAIIDHVCCHGNDFQIISIHLQPGLPGRVDGFFYSVQVAPSHDAFLVIIESGDRILAHVWMHV